MRRAAGALAAMLLTTSVFGLTAPVSAHAAPAGTVLVIPGEGVDVVAIRLRTSAGCPQQSKAYYAKLWGKGFPDAGQVITANTSAGMRHDAGFDVYLGQTMKDFAALAGGATLSGRYKISVYCIDRFPSQVHAEFTGELEFTTPTNYHALGASMPAGTPPPPLQQGGVEVPEAPGANPSPGAAAPAPGAEAPAQASANAVPAEPGTNLILLIVIAVLIGPAIWGVLVILRRRRTPATVSDTPKGSHD